MASVKEKLQRLHPREYANFTYAYPVLSRRSGGVSIGVNLNPDKICNFDFESKILDFTLPFSENGRTFSILHALMTGANNDIKKLSKTE